MRQPGLLCKYMYSGKKRWNKEYAGLQMICDDMIWGGGGIGKKLRYSMQSLPLSL